MKNIYRLLSVVLWSLCGLMVSAENIDTKGMQKNENGASLVQVWQHCFVPGHSCRYMFTLIRRLL